MVALELRRANRKTSGREARLCVTQQVVHMSSREKTVYYDWISKQMGVAENEFNEPISLGGALRRGRND
jgi:hypothetical protein